MRQGESMKEQISSTFIPIKNLYLNLQRKQIKVNQFLETLNLQLSKCNITQMTEEDTRILVEIFNYVINFNLRQVQNKLLTQLLIADTPGQGLLNRVLHFGNAKNIATTIRAVSVLLIKKPFLSQFLNLNIFY